MSAAHTVGPWKTVKNNAGLHVDGANSLVVCSLENCDKEHRESNARLIAAAPELLDVLRQVVRQVETGFFDHTATDHPASAIILAYEVIVKATGYTE